MSVRPIDMQAVILKVQEHRQSKELTANKLENDLLAMAPRIQKESEKLMSQVQSAKKKDDARLKNEDETSPGEGKGEEKANATGEDNKVLSEAEVEEQNALYEVLLQKNRRYSTDSKLVKPDIHRFDVKV